MEIYRLYNGSTNKRTMSTNICRRYDIYIYITSIHSFTIYHTYRASHTHISHILWLALLIIQHAIQLPLQTTHNSCLKVRNTRSFPFDEVVQILHRPWNTRRKSKFLYRKKLRETMGTQGAKMDEIRWQPVVQGVGSNTASHIPKCRNDRSFCWRKKDANLLDLGWLCNMFIKQNYVVVEQPIWNKNSSQKWIIITQVSGQTPPEKNDSLLSRQSSKNWAIGFFKNQHPNIQKFASI